MTAIVVGIVLGIVALIFGILWRDQWWWAKHYQTLAKQERWIANRWEERHAAQVVLNAALRAQLARKSRREVAK